MNRTFKTDKKPFILSIEFESSSPVNVKIEAQDKFNQSVYYCKKEVKINGSNVFKLKFNKTPKELIFKIYPATYQSYNDYLTFGKSQMKKFNIVSTKVLSDGSPISRFLQMMAVDAVIID